MDWKDALAGLKSEMPEGENIENIREEEHQRKESEMPQREPLRVLLDRRHRKGKTATLIEGFLCDEEKVKDIAKTLRQNIGTGGSSRGGDILLQGDCLGKVRSLLKEMGYRLKG